jgi:hypothetical protein
VHPAQGQSTRSLYPISTTPGEQLFAPTMSVAPAAVHTSSSAESGGWNQHSVGLDYVNCVVGVVSERCRGRVHLISSLVKTSQTDNHQQKPTENQRRLPPAFATSGSNSRCTSLGWATTGVGRLSRDEPLVIIFTSVQY